MPAPSPITLNVPGWEAECKRAGLVSDAQRAAALGMTRQAINEVQNGRKGVGGAFIAAALDVFETARFEDLFLTPRRRTRRAA